MPQPTEPNPGAAAVIDAHHHIWRRQDLLWLAGPVQPRIFGDYAPVRRDYLIGEYLEDIAGANVTKSVYVQTNWPAEHALREVEWVQSVAAAHGYPHAIVGFADLAAPNLESLLEAQLRHPNLRGVRQQIYWHENPAYRFASRPDLMNDAAWRRGLALLERHGLLFELQVFAPQMHDSAALAGAFPGIEFVLVHAGMLEETSAEGWARWREGMSALALKPNVNVKLSGLNTFTRKLDASLTAAIIKETLTLFGPERCMFGSNFPIEKIWTSYDALMQSTHAALSEWPEPARRAVLHDTAARLYRLS